MKHLIKSAVMRKKTCENLQKPFKLVLNKKKPACYVLLKKPEVFSKPLLQLFCVLHYAINYKFLLIIETRLKVI